MSLSVETYYLSLHTLVYGLRTVVSLFDLVDYILRYSDPRLLAMKCRRNTDKLRFANLSPGVIYAQCVNNGLGRGT